jgi:serine-type D-Ala-D-Ala endopeptidase (penicillin-binding protein 7)
MAKQNCFTKLLVSFASVLAMVAFVPAMPTAQTAAAARGAQKTPARATPAKSTAKKKKAYSATTARARRAQLARARAEARSRELKELQTPRFRVDEFGREVPDVRAEAAIIYNPETGEVLWENHSKDQRSIASITKVMTALVFLESSTPLSTIVTVERSDVARASTTYLRNGFKLTADDLLNLLLVGSDNAAARALARASYLG